MLPYHVFDKITLGPLTLYTWGIFVGLAFFLGWLLALGEAKRNKLNPDLLTTLSLWIVGGAVLGSRLLFILENYRLYQGNFPGIFKIWEGGFSYYGGFLGGIIALFIYIKKAKLNLKKILDILAPSLALGLAIGRIGCFLINDHLGERTNLPWAIKHPDGSLRHPVALYLSLAGLLCFLLLVIIKRYIKTEGLLAGFFLLIDSFLRFFLDFTRSRSHSLPFTDKHYFGFTLAQFISISIFLIAAYFTIKIIKKKNYAQRI